MKTSELSFPRIPSTCSSRMAAELWSNPKPAAPSVATTRIQPSLEPKVSTHNVTTILEAKVTRFIHPLHVYFPLFSLFSQAYFLSPLSRWRRCDTIFTWEWKLWTQRRGTHGLHGYAIFGNSSWRIRCCQHLTFTRQGMSWQPFDSAYAVKNVQVVSALPYANDAFFFSWSSLLVVFNIPHCPEPLAANLSTWDFKSKMYERTLTLFSILQWI